MANGLNVTPNQSESENFLYLEDIFQSSSNNSSGNNSGGNNSGGGNNTGGNNTGGNSTTSDAHCLELANLSINQTYYVTLNLVNTCSFSINYPGINASSNNSNVQGLYDGWWYQIGWSNSSYAVQPYFAQLTFNQSIQNGTNITLDFEATVMNCGQNNSSYHQCPNSNKSSLSIQFQYIKPQPKLVIWSTTISSSSTGNDRIDLGYYSENYTGNVNWEYTSTNGTSMHSSYASNSYRTTYIYPDMFGKIQICGSIPGDVSCTNVTRVVRPLDGHITSPTNNYTTHSQSVYVEYFAENFTSGSIRLNGNIVDYISPSYHSNNNSTNNGSSVGLPYGWSTICLHLSGDNNSTLSDCIDVYREPAVVRLVIHSATLSSDNSYVMVRYKAENFSGYVYWNHTGNSTQSSSYVSSYLRTTYIYPSTFGTIQICGSVSNYSVTECVSINRIARLVEGEIYPPSNNLTTSNRVYFSYYANNHTDGNLSLNGVIFDTLGSYFDNYSSNTTQTWNNNTTQISRNIPYGHSTICLNLVGEDGTTLSDCFSIERQTPPHFVHIDYPNSASSFTGYMVNLTYTLGNSSNHYFTVNGATTLPISNVSNQTTLYVGFGSHTVCVVSFSLSNVMDSDCVNVIMVDPYADSDSDGVIDTSDLCSNTTQSSSVDLDGCAPYQLDSDSDGITDDLDICQSTQQFSNVDTNGCAAYQRDSDGDGIMDNMDVCPSTPANSVVDSYGCAISQTDSDNDGVMDDVDLCPATFVGSQVNVDGCAPSQLDSDSDGVVDSFDQCPNTVVGNVVDQTGCVPTSGGNSSNGSSGGDSSSSGLPSIGIVGTLASIGLGLIAINSRRDE